MSFESTFSLIREKAEQASPIGSTMKFTLDDQNIYIDGRGSENIVSDSDSQAACTIKAALKDFESIISGEMNPMTAFMLRKIKVDGDMGLAMKLQSFF